MKLFQTLFSKMIASLALGVVISLSIIHPTAAIEHKTEIILGAENGWIPYSNSDGTGMSNDIIKAAYAAVGIKVTYNVKPLNRLLKETKEGKILGAFNIGQDTHRATQYLFHKTKLYDAVCSYYHNADVPLKEHSKEDLKNGEVTLGLVAGYGYGSIFSAMKKAKKFTVQNTHSEEQNLQKLVKHRIDATVLYDKTASILLEEMGLKGKIEKAFENEHIGMFVGFSKVLPESQHYADLLDEGLKIIQENGQYDKIISAY